MHEPEQVIKKIDGKQYLLCTAYCISEFADAPTHALIELDTPLIDDIEKAVEAIASINGEVQNGVCSITLNGVGVQWGDYDEDEDKFERTSFYMGAGEMVLAADGVYWEAAPSEFDDLYLMNTNYLYYTKFRKLAEQAGLKFALGEPEEKAA